ncbi:hypothetical protein GCM10020331_045830 [Ectobacillus funiculus]
MPQQEQTEYDRRPPAPVQQQAPKQQPREEERVMSKVKKSIPLFMGLDMERKK